MITQNNTEVRTDPCGEEYQKGYTDGRWDMFEEISSVLYGKQCYFREDNGMVYSRLSGKYLRSTGEARKEFTDWYD